MSSKTFAPSFGRLALRLALLSSTVFAGVAIPIAAQAQAPDTAQTASAREVRFNVPAQELDSALTSIADQGGIRIFFTSAELRGLRTSGVSGAMTVEQALSQALTGTGFGWRYREAGTVVIERAPQSSNSVIRLDPVRVEGVTEGTGSYTTGLTNTATRLNLSLRETPQSVTIVTRQRIEDQGTNELRDVVSQTIGLYMNETGPIGADTNPIYSRGFALENYQVDGVPQTTRAGYRGDVADMAIYDRVEVVRGASGLLSGVGEPSGVINMVRKLPTVDLQGYIVGKVGSWDHYRVEGDVSGPLAAGGRIRARAVGAYQDSGSFIDRLGLEKKILYGIAEADLGTSTLVSLGVEYQDIKTTGGGRYGPPIYRVDGTPANLPRSTNTAAKWGYSLRENTTVFGSVEHHIGRWRLDLDLEHASRDYDSVMPALLSTNLPLGGPDTLLTRRFVGHGEQSAARFHAVGPFALFGREHELVAGASYSYFHLKSPSVRSPSTTVADIYEFIRTGDSPRGDVGFTGSGSESRDWQSGLYLATRLKPLEPLSIVLGGRLSNWKTRRDSYNASGVVTRGVATKEDWVFTPYAGVVLDLTKNLSLYGSYTDIFKPQTQRDANGDILAPAVGSNLEGGFKLAFYDDRLNISAAYYRTQKDNAAEYVPGPGGAANYGPTGDFVYVGLDGTKTTGFEIEVSGQITPRWQVSGGYSHANPRYPDGSRRYTEIPTDTFKLFSTYELGGPLEGLTLGGNLRWQSSMDTPYAYPGIIFRQGDFAIVDFVASYDITPKLKATLNVNNLFDKTYYTDIAFSGWYGAPRSAFLTLRFGF